MQKPTPPPTKKPAEAAADKGRMTTQPRGLSASPTILARRAEPAISLRSSPTENETLPARRPLKKPIVLAVVRPPVAARWADAAVSPTTRMAGRAASLMLPRLLRIVRPGDSDTYGNAAAGHRGARGDRNRLRAQPWKLVAATTPLDVVIDATFPAASYPQPTV